MELCEIFHRIGIKLITADDLFKAVIPQDDEIEFITDNHKLVYSNLKHLAIQRDIALWKEKVNQGRLAREAIEHADMSLSNQHLVLLGLSDRLVQFIIKGRLQLLETQGMLTIYYPDIHNKKCPSCNFPTDTTSHVLNGCMTFRQCYIDRHDRSVDHIHDELMKSPLYKEARFFKNKVINHNVIPTLDISELRHTKPDVLVLDDRNKVAFIIEVSHPIDAFFDSCYNTKFEKYMPLSMEITKAGYKCKVVTLIIGSLGYVHKRFVPGLKLLGLNQVRSKAIGRFLSVSSMIGSYRVWRRRWR